jgi:hypothetical protein
LHKKYKITRRNISADHAIILSIKRVDHELFDDSAGLERADAQRPRVMRALGRCLTLVCALLGTEGVHFGEGGIAPVAVQRKVSILPIDASVHEATCHVGIVGEVGLLLVDKIPLHVTCAHVGQVECDPSVMCTFLLLLNVSNKY